MVKSTLIVWEDLGLSPIYASYVLFDFIINFNIIHGHVGW